MDQNLSVEATPVEPLTYDDKNPQVHMYCDRQSHHTRLRQSVEMQKREKNNFGSMRRRGQRGEWLVDIYMGPTYREVDRFVGIRSVERRQHTFRKEPLVRLSGKIHNPNQSTQPSIKSNFTPKKRQGTTKANTNGQHLERGLTPHDDSCLAES